MSNLRFARGPLLIGLVLGIVGALLIVAPSFASGLPFEEYYSITGGALGAMTILLIIMSAIAGSRSEEEDDDDDDELTDDDLVPTAAFGPGSAEQDDVAPTKMTRAEKKAAKAEAARAKKEAAEQAKFEKQAAKEAAKAEKAAKKGKKGKGDSDEDDEWFESMKGDSPAVSPLATAGVAGIAVVEGSANDEEVPSPANYYQELGEMDQEPAPSMSPDFFTDETSGFAGVQAADPTEDELGSATDLPMYDAVPVDGSKIPEWADAAYNDPTFVPPYTEEAEALPVSEEFAEAVLTDEVVVTDEGVFVEADDIAGSFVAADLESDGIELDELLVDGNITSEELVEFTDDQVIAEDAIDAPMVSEESDDALIIEEALIMDDFAEPLAEVEEMTEFEEMIAEDENDQDAVDSDEDELVSDAISDDFAVVNDFLVEDSHEDYAADSYEDSHEDEATSVAEVEIIEPEPEPEPEVTPEDPEFKIAQLAAQMGALVEQAHREVVELKEIHRADKERREAEFSRVSDALAEARDEVGRMADALAESTAEKSADLDARALAMQAEIEVSRARLEREQAKARLRQVRLAIMSKEPVDTELLAIVEKSLSDMDEVPAAVEEQDGHAHSDSDTGSAPSW